MKHRLIYVLVILLIVLASCLFLKNREHKTASGNQVIEVVPVNTVDTNTTKTNVTVNNGKNPVEYLTPAYEVTVKNNILYASKKNETDAEEPLKFDLYQPVGDNNKQRPVFIFVHGGGYSGGSKYEASEFSTGLAKRGYAVLSIDYRLKKDPFINFSRTLSDACEDISDVIKWANDNAEIYGLDTNRIVIGGDSAGGNLSMNFVNQYLIMDPSTFKSVFAIVDIYGGDLTRSAERTLPPILIIHGTIDKVEPYQKSVELAEQLKEIGVYHNFLTMEDVGHDYKKNEDCINEVIEMTSHFLWNVMRSSDIARLPESSGIKAASGDVFDIKLSEAYSIPSSEHLNVDLPEGWLFSSAEDGMLRIQVPEGMKRGNHSLFVSRGADPLTEMGFTVNVNVIDPLVVRYETFYDESRKTIRTLMDVTNRSTNNFSGLVEVDYETGESTQGTFTSVVEDLEPGNSVRLDIPELARGQRTLKAYNEEGTLLQTAMDSFNALLLPKLRQPVQIDGNLLEWSDQAHFDVKDVKNGGWKGEKDISATGSLSWDDDNLYLAVEVIDDKHEQPASGDDIWIGDSIQIGYRIKIIPIVGLNILVLGGVIIAM